MAEWFARSIALPLGPRSALNQGFHLALLVGASILPVTSAAVVSLRHYYVNVGGLLRLEKTAEHDRFLVQVADSACRLPRAYFNRYPRKRIRSGEPERPS